MKKNLFYENQKLSVNSDIQTIYFFNEKNFLIKKINSLNYLHFTIKNNTNKLIITI